MVGGSGAVDALHDRFEDGTVPAGIIIADAWMRNKDAGKGRRGSQRDAALAPVLEGERTKAGRETPAHVGEQKAAGWAGPGW